MTGSAVDSAGRVSQTIDSGHQSTITQIFLVNSVASVHVKSDLKECDINRTMTTPPQQPNPSVPYDYHDQPMTMPAMDGLGGEGTGLDPCAFPDLHSQVAGHPDPGHDLAAVAAASHGPLSMAPVPPHTHHVHVDLEAVQKKAGGGNTKARGTMTPEVSDHGDDEDRIENMRCQCPICVELHAMFGSSNSDTTDDEESVTDEDAHDDSPHKYDGCGPIADIISVTTPPVVSTTTAKQEAPHGHHGRRHRPKCSAVKWIRLRSSRLKQIKVVAKTIKRSKVKGKCGKGKCGKEIAFNFKASGAVEVDVDLLESSESC